VCVAATAALVLAACGDLSLNNVLSNESPGVFRLSPEAVNLQVSQEFTFSATGGFTPYDYKIVSGIGEVVKDHSWIYQAPDDIGAEDFIEVTIKATDQVGDSDTALVRVFKPFYLVDGTEMIVQNPGSVTIEAAGGVAPNGYSWAVDGTTVATRTNPFHYTPDETVEVVTRIVGVTDDIGNYIEGTVIVLPQNGAPLTIFPSSAGVELDGTVSFSAFGGTPPYSWSAMTGIITATDSTAAYKATAVGTDTVTLKDSADPQASVDASVTVTEGSIQPLVLSPEAPTVTAVGDHVQFGTTGGVPPYAYSSAPPGYIDRSGLYTQMDGRRKVNVLVKDSVGATDVTTVYYSP
jgi:hypothetical protein